MKRFTLKVLAGVAAVACSGAALANMTLAPGTPGPGSIFVSVIDLDKGTSFTYDTGATVASFNGSFTPVDLSTVDGGSNWASFIASTAAGDNIVYQVQGVNTPASQQFVLDMSSNAGTGTTNGKLGNINNDQLFQITAVNNFVNAANSIVQAPTKSVWASSSVNSPANAFDSLSLGTLLVPARAALGTAISFYQWVLGSDPTNTLQKAVFTSLGGKWTLTTAGLLSFSGAAAVPLPPSVILLLSGFVLMALISRRRSTNGLLSFGTPA
jgi:hypothetical protein